MRKLSSLITGAALALTAGALGCVNVDPTDPFDSLTSIGAETTGDGDGDQTGDGDGDATTTGDGDGDACASVGDSCAGGETCCDGLSCQADGTCGLGTGDGDGDATGDGDGDAMLPDCLDDDAWCPIASACTTGMFLSLQGDPVLGAYGWCAWDCDPSTMDVSMCPAAPANTQAVCLATSMADPTQGGCGLACTVGSSDCPEGSDCFEIQPGAALCMYDNPNN